MCKKQPRGERVVVEGGQAMGGGILSGARFAFGRAGTGGLLRVSPIGFDSFFG